MAYSQAGTAVKRAAAILMGLMALWLPASAWAGAAMDDIRKVQIPIYHPDSGDLLYLLEAAKVTPQADNPKMLDAQSVRITAYYKGKAHIITAKRGGIDVGQRNASLAGDVLVTFGDEQASRVETERLYWYGDKGVATTEPSPADGKPAAALTQSTVPVRITRLDMATEGYGLQLWLNEPKAGKTGADSTDRLVIGRNIRTVIAPRSTDWLLRAGGSASDAKPRPSAKAGKAAKPRGPVIVTCTGPFAVYRADLSAVYSNNVRVVQDDQSLKCDILTISFQPIRKPAKPAKPAPAAPAKEGEKPAAPAKKLEPEPARKVVLESVTASGSVVIDNARTIARADLAVWHQQDGFAMLTGRPARVNWDNGNQLTAGRIRRMRGGDELDCSVTPDHTQSVYLVALTAAGDVLPVVGRPDAP